VGYIVAGIRDVRLSRVGDTVTEADRPTARPLPGFREVRPMVFAGLYPVESQDYLNLKGALEKLQLNDASFSFTPRRRWRSGSDSAADSWGSCTWRSSRSGSSANSI